MKNALHILAVLYCLLAACQNQLGCPDIQDNEILTNNPPTSTAYQDELTRLISEDTHEVNYYFEKRENEYLVLNVYGWGYCGQLHVLLKQEDDFSKKLQNEEGRQGAKLHGLKLLNVDGQMVYQGLEGIMN